MIRYESNAVDLTNGVEYYKWSDTYQWANFVGAWNKGSITYLQTFVEYNQDHVLGIL